jgi:hypothetical protein
MKTHEIEILGLLNRRHYGRLNLLTAALPGSAQNRAREIASLAKRAYLQLHPPGGNGDLERTYPHWFFRIYSKTPKANKALRAYGHIPIDRQEASEFWHQVMIDDILLSIEAHCRRHDLTFTDEHDILQGQTRELPTRISYTFEDGHTEEREIAIEPDALFAINGRYFALEADRVHEPIRAETLKRTSYFRKILQYRDVFKNRTYERVWRIPGLTVLNVTINPRHAQNIADYMRDGLKYKASWMLFGAIPELASTRHAPTPNLPLFGDWQRVGYPPFNMQEELTNGRTPTKNT